MSMVQVDSYVRCKVRVAVHFPPCGIQPLGAICWKDSSSPHWLTSAPLLKVSFPRYFCLVVFYSFWFWSAGDGSRDFACALPAVPLWPVPLVFLCFCLISLLHYSFCSISEIWGFSVYDSVEMVTPEMSPQDIIQGIQTGSHRPF
jgi:hypothetical protein